MQNQKGLVIITLIILSFLLNAKVYSQCSDAGVCTLGSHKHMEEEEVHRNSSIYIGDRIGYSGKDEDVTFNSIIVSGSFALSKNINGSFSLPYNMQSGAAGDFNGIGDLIVGFSYNHPVKKNSSIDFQLGGKFATGDANQSSNFYGTESAPPIYQSGSGINYILLGATYNYQEFAVTLGGQIPLNRSTNEAYQLKTAPDILLGLSYTYPASDKFYFTGEILTIKRTAESNAIFGAPNNSSDSIGVDLAESDFLQMNVQATFNYLITKEVGIKLQGAIPLLKRETNYDGTKRAFTVSAGLNYFFNMNL